MTKIGRQERGVKKRNEYIRIRYNDGVKRLAMWSRGDWIDLRAAERVVLRKGDYKRISLGVAMELPEGYEAIVAARSSSFEKWGFIPVNGIGIIDNSYNGNGDIWNLLVYATRDAIIEKDERIAQFRILKNQPVISFSEVEDLGHEDRGGIGSTGVE